MSRAERNEHLQVVEVDYAREGTEAPCTFTNDAAGNNTTDLGGGTIEYNTNG